MDPSGQNSAVRSRVRKASSLDDLRLRQPGGGVPGGLLQQEQKLGKQGSSLLHIAAYFGRISVVEELLEKGFCMEDKNSLRWSSHHYLCRFHQPLNKKLSLGLKPKPAKSQSRSFKFTYLNLPVSSGGGEGATGKQEGSAK